MIDVIKRLAELDAKNPNIVKEGADLAECGMMPEMGMEEMSRPQMPASINITAGSGEELSGMLKDIMQLAGVSQKSAEPLSTAPAPLGAPTSGLTIEPGQAMRSVIDKLNPADDGGDDITQAMGDIDDDGDHDMHDHEAEKDEGYYNDPDGDEDSAADQADQADTERRGREEELGEYDNTPADPRKPPPFSANKFAHQENQPGQGDRMDGTAPKAYADMNEAVADLFAQYKNFVLEGKPSAGMSAKEKSSLAKKASAGKDIGKPGKSFDKVAAKAGGGEKGKKIAAAAMWKNAAKK